MEVTEKNILIAKRVPPGDQWCLVDDKKNTVHKSLTEALETWYQVNTAKPKAFRLDLVQGKLYAIFSEEVEIEEEKPKQYSIYGDYTF